MFSDLIWKHGFHGFLTMHANDWCRASEVVTYHQRSYQCFARDSTAAKKHSRKCSSLIQKNMKLFCHGTCTLIFFASVNLDACMDFGFLEESAWQTFYLNVQEKANVPAVISSGKQLCCWSWCQRWYHLAK